MSENNPTSPSGAASRPIDTFIRIILLGGLLAWCLLILAPFASILLWAVILAVALYPFFAMVARWMGGRKGLAATVIVLLGIALVAVPSYHIGDSLVSSVAEARAHLTTEEIHMPQLPAEWYQDTGMRRMIADRWPANDGALADVVRDHSDKIRVAAAFVLGLLGSFLGDMVKMLLSIIVMGLFLANAKSGGEATERFLARAIGPKGPGMVNLAERTIRNVAKGILGVALIQTIMFSLGVFIAGVPGAGLLAVGALLLAIVQVGVGPLAIGVIIYSFAAMDTLPAVLLTIWMVITTISDNVLKPLLLGRGATVPMVVIFLGAIGGFILSGFIGLFTGAVILSMGYVLMQDWMSEA